MTALIGNFLREAYRHPLFSLFTATALVVFAVFSLSYFATAKEVENLRNTTSRELASLNHGLENMQINDKITALEEQIRNHESEIFDLERIIDSGDARDRDYERLSELESKLGAAKRELQRIQ